MIVTVDAKHKHRFESSVLEGEGRASPVVDNPPVAESSKSLNYLF